MAQAALAETQSQPLYTVHWCKTWKGAICAPAECGHTNEFASEVLTINQRLERRNGRGQSIIAMDGCICMNCGADTTGHLSLVEGLARCMAEHGWNRETGERLHDLVEFHHDTICADPPEGEVWPLWFLYAWGWTGKEIVDALNAGALVDGEAA